ncbi:MAG: aspartate--ammonia ligase [Tissierellia bacterium]|nr:aspartate--ammonia ligase [Tissierellia bacterium]
MMNNSRLNPRETQIAIKKLKDFFETRLADTLNLTRVSAPLFVRPETGLNDNLSGKELPVSFQLTQYQTEVEIVQSLAKWKREALDRYGFRIYEGIYTDMDAIRPNEELDAIHSIYVDQWDWEKIIKKSDRNDEYLKYIVRSIYDVFRMTEDYVAREYPMHFSSKLPSEIKFISSQELMDKYPNLNAKQRERMIAKEYGAVFIEKIGGALSGGEPHDTRSPDYDDWNLNGDIIFYNPVMNDALELSSMGIRVDEESLLRQLKISGFEERLNLDYHRNLVSGKLPFTVGGGIGQSRICMFFLEKQHIGEVQASVWTPDILDECKKKGIDLL